MTMRFELTTKILFGVGRISRLGEEAKKLGQKALIVTYPDIRRIGLMVDEGAAVARSEKVDLIIGLGGGSAMDTAKGIALASSSTKPIWSYAGIRAEVSGTVPPIIQVPTMAGTGSEVNSGAIITNWETHVKTVVGSPYMQAKVAIIDPELTLTVPKNQTRAGGVDAFAHVVEPYITDEAPNPLTDGIRETVMRMIVKYLPLVLARLDNIEARTQLSWASTMAMSQFVGLGGGRGWITCHGIEHAVRRG